MSGSSNLAVIDRPELQPPPPPGGPPQQAQRPPATRVPDIYERELAEAEAALAAEEAGTPAAPASPNPTPAAPAAPAAEPGQMVMVPKARFDEAIAERNRWRDAAMYHEGRAEAAQVGTPAPATPNAPPAPPAEHPDVVALRQIEESWNKDWADYDTGVITGTELGPKLAALVGQIVGLNMNRVFAEVDTHVKRLLANLPAPVGAVDAALLEQQKAKLYAEHPWALAVSEDEGRFLIDLAVREANALGTPFPKGPVGQMRLTKRVAEMATFYMPQWHPGEEPPKPTQPAAAAPPATPPAVPAAPRSPSPAFRGPDQRHVQEALRRQANLPPTAPGSAGSAVRRLTLDDVQRMTDAELENLPPGELDRLEREGAPS